MDTTVNYELETEQRSYYLGSLRDFGLGNPSGVTSELADANRETREEYGKTLLEAIAPVTDFAHYSCGDGRECLSNADGSAPEIRKRHFGGTGTLAEIAMNGDAPVVDTISTETSMDGIGDIVQNHFAKINGVLPSAHYECAAVDGSIAHNQFIAESEAPVKFAEAIMEHSEVIAFSGLGYDENLAGKVRDEASKTAQLEQAKSWNGKHYVEITAVEEPAGVERLDVDENHEFGGHNEGTVVLVLSRNREKSISRQKLKELGLLDALVLNVDASVDVAKSLNGRRGDEGGAQLLIADLAKVAAIAKSLPSEDTPVYLLVV